MADATPRPAPPAFLRPPAFEKALLRRLRTPRGLAWLFVALYGGALAAAVAMAAARPFFARHVRERYPDPPAAVRALAAEVEAGRAGREEVARLLPSERAALYHLFVGARPGPALSPAALARTLAEADPDLARRLVERTLVAGDAAQRARAIEFALAAGRPEPLEGLRWARERAARLRDAELVAALDQGLGSIAKPGGGR